VEIQRQSDYYGLDRPEPRQAHLTADQIAALIAGPQITPGLLNTRTAWREGDPWTYAPENLVPDEDEEEYEPTDEEYALDEELEHRERYVPEDLVERRREAKTEDDDAEWGEDGNPQGYVDPFAGMSK
jgi:hypothetical protein